MNTVCKSKDVPFDPDSIVEKYSCDSELTECILNSCDVSKHHGLTVDDVENGEANEDDLNSDFETNMIRYYQWKRDDNGYLTKLMVEADGDEAWFCGSQRCKSLQWESVGPSLAASNEPLAHRRNVASLSLFCRYYFGGCSTELGELVPLPYSRGRSTCYSHRLHNFSVIIPRSYKDVYVNSFTPPELGSGILYL